MRPERRGGRRIDSRWCRYRLRQLRGLFRLARSRVRQEADDRQPRDDACGD
jgi:hypothetical protein